MMTSSATIGSKELPQKSSASAVVQARSKLRELNGAQGEWSPAFGAGATSLDFAPIAATAPVVGEFSIIFVHYFSGNKFCGVLGGYILISLNGV